ncbi:MAG TPA: urate oxidase [Candidatus Acidoferrales bacterium]|nr:urate oxidase [Candidatus Acidoferrales bacterium]
MDIKLAQNDYGESCVRLFRVMHRGGLHEVKDLSVSARFEGAFGAAYTSGDNRAILPPDTIKNTIYVLARQYPAEAIEDFAFHLVEHFLTYNPQVSRVHLEIAERPWSRIPIGEKGHASAFVANAGERRSARISATREKTNLESGIEDLRLLKTSGASFENFLRDPYTTQESRSQMILGSEICSHWTYEFPEPEMPFSTMWHGIRKTLVETFAAHESKSPQHMLYALGHAVLDNFEALAEIRLAISENHCRLVDLKPFGMENDNEVFAPAAEPRALFSATIRRNGNLV